MFSAPSVRILRVETDEVRRRAYELYEASAREDGLAGAHWALAEACVDTVAEAASTAQPVDGARRLILVRHARRVRLATKPESEHRMDGWPAGVGPSARVDEDDGKTTRKSGWRRTLDIAVSLAERLEAERVHVTHVFHSPHEVARQTAIVYAAVLARHCLSKVVEAVWLDPDRFAQMSREEIDAHLRRLWEYGSRRPRDGDSQAIVLVGHQPQLTELADIVLRGAALPPWRRLTRPLPLPIGSAEAACLRLDPRARLRWLLTEKGGTLAGEIKEKLRSKVDTAKFFLGALAVNAGLLVNTNLWSTVGLGPLAVLGLGAALIFTGLVLAVATLLGYDALNMPPEFWAEGARLDGRNRKGTGAEPLARGSVLRPPSEATVVLFYEMVNVWNRFFIPALVSSIAGVACFLLALGLARLDVLLGAEPGGIPTAPPGSGPLPTMHPWAWAGAALALLSVALAAAAYYRARGPRLGFED